MASDYTARKAIHDRMIAQWNTVNGDLTFEGEPYEPDGTKAYVRLFVRHEESTQRSTSTATTRRFRRPGRIMVQVFSPSEAGVYGLASMQDLIRAIFEGVSFGDIDTYASTVREGGTEGGYIRGVVETRFDYDEIR